MSPPQQPAMYLFVNSALGMSPGKLGAQLAHAAVESYRAVCVDLSDFNRLAIPDGHNVDGDVFVEPRDVQRWRLGGHYMKLVMDGGDAPRIWAIDRYLRDRGFFPSMIVDEGHTEDTYFETTALGIFVADKNEPHTAATFSEFKLLRPERPQQPQRRRSLAFERFERLVGRR